MAAHRPWRHLTLSQAVSDLLLRMARKPNVIFAVSNAYDYVYLRRQLFASSPPQMVQNIVPWPGVRALERRTHSHIHARTHTHAYARTCLCGYARTRTCSHAQSHEDS
eukprot:5194423-Pleurochrysis_carterae.AAC.1